MFDHIEWYAKQDAVEIAFVGAAIGAGAFVVAVLAAFVRVAFSPTDFVFQWKANRRYSGGFGWYFEFVGQCVFVPSALHLACCAVFTQNLLIAGAVPPKIESLHAAEIILGAAVIIFIGLGRAGWIAVRQLAWVAQFG